MTKLKSEKREKNPAFKASNDELLKIAAGINHIVLTSDSTWTLASEHNEMVLDVRFSKPVLKRPLFKSDKMIALEWAKYHPRFWRLTLTLNMWDEMRQQAYTDTIEIDTPQQCKLDELTEHVRQAWVELESGANPKHIRGRHWTARIIQGHERKGAA
jgi:hypothetical protein